MQPYQESQLTYFLTDAVGLSQINGKPNPPLHLPQLHPHQAARHHPSSYLSCSAKRAPQVSRHLDFSMSFKEKNLICYTGIQVPEDTWERPRSLCVRGGLGRGTQPLRAASEPADDISGPPAPRNVLGQALSSPTAAWSLSLFLDSATIFTNQCQGSEQGFSVVAAAGSGLEAH